MTMMRKYDPDSEREYTAPKAPRIVEPEPMIHKFPKVPIWLKAPVLSLVYLCVGCNLVNFFAVNHHRIEGMSKSEIEERIDGDHSDKGDLVKFIIDDFSKPGRELAYLIRGDGKQ